MKFLMFSMFDVAKTADIAQLGDKLAKTPGRKVLASYICMGQTFPGVPPNTMSGVSIADFESNEAMAAAIYPMSLAGANVWAVPVLETTPGRTTATEKKYRK
jgi:hypothetical protein